jgi:hypothetical protein
MQHLFHILYPEAHLNSVFGQIQQHVVCTRRAAVTTLPDEASVDSFVPLIFEQGRIRTADTTTRYLARLCRKGGERNVLC